MKSGTKMDSIESYIPLFGEHVTCRDHDSVVSRYTALKRLVANHFPKEQKLQTSVLECLGHSWMVAGDTSDMTKTARKIPPAAETPRQMWSISAE